MRHLMHRANYNAVWLWIRVVVIFRRLFFLINKRPTNRWVAVVSWMTYLTVDLRGFIAQLQVKCTVDSLLILVHFALHPPYCIPWFPMFHACMTRIAFSSPRIWYPVISQEQKRLDYFGGRMFDCHGVWSLRFDRSFIFVQVSWLVMF